MTDGSKGPLAMTLGAMGHRARTIMLVVIVFMGGVGSASLLTADARDVAPTLAQGSPAAGDSAATPQVELPVSGTPAATNPCDALAPGTGSEPWVQSELYFGRTIPGSDGGVVTDELWADFLDREVTPRFPDGLTVLDGYGQFLNASGVIAQEDSTVLIILYPLDETGATSALLDEVREAYKAEFNQQSVLRTDTYPVCTAF